MVLVLLLAGCGDSQSGNSNAAVPLYDDLGNHHYAITTRVPEAQQYFDQGLRLHYAFNHAEAIRAFEEAARLDPDCASCYWETALSYGPNINARMDSASGVATYEALQKARCSITSTPWKPSTRSVPCRWLNAWPA